MHPSKRKGAKRIGRVGSTDRVILHYGNHGLYLSLRLAGAYGLRFAFGPGYSNRVTVRR